MNLASYVYRRNFHDFSDRGGIEVLQIQQHDLPIGRIQLMDQLKEAFDIHAIVRFALGAAIVRYRVHVFQTPQEPGVCPVLANDVRSRYVVCDAIDPGTQGTSRLETFKAKPQSQVNLLQKVSTLFKIEFVGSDESVKSAAVSCGRLLIEFVLTLAHIGDSRQFERFVTDFFVGQIY